MSVLLGAVTRRAAGELVEQCTGRIERYGGGGRCRCRRFASLFASGDCIDGTERVAASVVLDDGRRGTREVNRDGDDHAGQKALVELPGLAADVERAVLAHAATHSRGERGGERGLVERPRD